MSDHNNTATLPAVSSPDSEIAEIEYTYHGVRRSYVVQLAATGQFFNIQKHTDENGVTWLDIAEVSQ